MDLSWKSVAEVLGKEAPLLGTLFGGPAGAAAGALVSAALGTANTPDAIQTALTTDPQAIVKIREVEAAKVVELQQLLVTAAQNQLASETQRILAVNATMQAEATSNHWPTYTWRPFIGFMFGLYVSSLWILPLFKVQPITMSSDLVLAVGGILGIASYFRGKMQADPSVPTDNRG
jgi:hypothetical protein